MLKTLVPLLRRDGELDLTDAAADLLVAMSAATIDRRLANSKAVAGVHWPVPHQTRLVVEIAEPGPDPV